MHKVFPIQEISLERLGESALLLIFAFGALRLLSSSGGNGEPLGGMFRAPSPQRCWWSRWFTLPSSGLPRVHSSGLLVLRHHGFSGSPVHGIHRGV